MQDARCTVPLESIVAVPHPSHHGTHRVDAILVRAPHSHPKHSPQPMRIVVLLYCTVADAQHSFVALSLCSRICWQPPRHCHWHGRVGNKMVVLLLCLSFPSLCVCVCWCHGMAGHFMLKVSMLKVTVLKVSTEMLPSTAPESNWLPASKIGGTRVG